MKIRTDFVTNSSSSSYVLNIRIETKNGLGKSLSLPAWDDEDCYESFEDNLINLWFQFE